MAKIPEFADISSTKYNGNRYNEPSWYPENPYRVKRYSAFDMDIINAGYHWAEMEVPWDEGRNVVLETVKNLPSAKRKDDGILVVIPNGNGWFPKGEYKEKMEKAKARGYKGFLSLNTEYHTCWEEGFVAMLNTIKYLPVAKKVSSGTQVFIADDKMTKVKEMSRKEEYEWCIKKGWL